MQKVIFKVKKKCWLKQLFSRKCRIVAYVEGFHLDQDGEYTILCSYQHFTLGTKSDGFKNPGDKIKFDFQNGDKSVRITAPSDERIILDKTIDMPQTHPIGGMRIGPAVHPRPWLWINWSILF